MTTFPKINRGTDPEKAERERDIVLCRGFMSQFNVGDDIVTAFPKINRGMDLEKAERDRDIVLCRGSMSQFNVG